MSKICNVDPTALNGASDNCSGKVMVVGLSIGKTDYTTIGSVTLNEKEVITTLGHTKPFQPIKVDDFKSISYSKVWQPEERRFESKITFDLGTDNAELRQAVQTHLHSCKVLMHIEIEDCEDQTLILGGDVKNGTFETYFKKENKVDNDASLGGGNETTNTMTYTFYTKNAPYYSTLKLADLQL